MKKISLLTLALICSANVSLQTKCADEGNGEKIPDWRNPDKYPVLLKSPRQPTIGERGSELVRQGSQLAVILAEEAAFYTKAIGQTVASTTVKVASGGAKAVLGSISSQADQAKVFLERQELVREYEAIPRAYLPSDSKDDRLRSVDSADEGQAEPSKQN